MKNTRRTFLTLTAATSAAAVTLHAQRSGRSSAAPSVNAPPTANSDAESRVLGVLEQARRSGEVFYQVDEDSGRMMRLLAENAGAKNAVEIGTSTGCSALWLSLALLKTGGKLTTFEMDAERAATARKHFQQAGVEQIITVVEGDAHDSVKKLNGPVDFAFIDADKEGYVDYLNKLLPLIRPGGVVVADNVTMASDYVKAVTTNPALETLYFSRATITLKKR